MRDQRIRELLRLGRFGLVGLSATLVHAGVYALLTALALSSALAANFIGYVCAVLVSLIGHSRWTFAGHQQKKTGAALTARFIVTSLTSLGLNTLLVWLVAHQADLDPLWAIPGMVLVVPLLTYLLMKHWVFRVQYY
ncbi:MAG: GtrA family protein [Wenzhouxiangella sp.]|nr:GtrA family protein [Wenzhouxiangella sp.]MCH8477694.1 GtrA family protein [Wenzhouxiangella sp.]TVR94058.1 MAG: GtrA family protein [Wenzhouxiangellaceae bacterium]